MTPEERAQQKLLELAKYKAEKEGLDKKVIDKSKMELRDLGINPDNAARTAALAHIINNASQGKIGHNFGDFDVEAQVKPEEKKLKLGWNKRF